MSTCSLLYLSMQSHISGSISYSYDPFLCCKGDCDEGQVEDCYNQVVDRKIKKKECGAISKSDFSMDECVDADEEVAIRERRKITAVRAATAGPTPPIAGRREVACCRNVHTVDCFLCLLILSSSL